MAQGIGEFILTHPDIKIPQVTSMKRRVTAGMLRGLQRGKTYSINEGNSASWDKSTTDPRTTRRSATLCDTLVTGRHAQSRGLKLCRYHGWRCTSNSLLWRDLHVSCGCPSKECNLVLHSPSWRDKACKGKLRLLYECGPMGYITEKAGGRAITGKMEVCKHVRARACLTCCQIRDIQPVDLHERAPIFLGSKLDVDEVEAIYAKNS
eukprot:754633-Hanusia_phi.AAC.1